MRSIVLLVLSLLACSAEQPPAATPPAAPVPAEHQHEHGAHEHGAHEHGAHEHGAGDHGHAATHGGIQKELEGLHVEGLLLPEGVLVWLTDAHNAPLAVEGWTGSAVVKGASGVATVELRPMGDHLHAATPLTHGQPASVVVTLTKDGKAQSLSFETESVGLPVHDHTALHGGEVGMFGNWHVEYLWKDGQHQVWLSDAKRQAITAGVTGTIEVGGTALPLVADPSGALTAKGDAGPVTVKLVADGQAITLPFATSAH